MIRIFIALALSLLSLTSCIDHKIEETQLRNDLQIFFSHYQKAVNTLDELQLHTIISQKFSFYEQTKPEYIKQLLGLTTYLDSVSFGNVRVENYKILTDVSISGSLVYKPPLSLPLFKEQTPFLQGTFTRKSVFAFTYEQDGLRLLAENPLSERKDFAWGKAQPELNKPIISKTIVQPGDIVDCTFNAKCGDGNDIVFIYVNEQLLGSYALTGQDDDNEINYSISIPTQAQKGSTYEIRILAIAGKNNALQPQDSSLQGIKLISFGIPVR